MKKIGEDSCQSWIILLACSLISFVTSGLLYGPTGVLYVAYMDTTQQTAERASWVMALTPAMSIIGGPLGAILSTVLPIRTIVMVGIVLGFVGTAAGYFTLNFYYLIATYGVINGIGTALASTALSALINNAFDRHRETAMGIFCSVTPVAGAIMPVLTQTLYDLYGLQGTFLLLGGIYLNAMVGAMLFMDIMMKTLDTGSENPSVSEKCENELLDKGTYRTTNKEDSAESRLEEDTCLSHSVKESASEKCERKPLARRTYKTSFSEDFEEDSAESRREEDICLSHSVKESASEKCERKPLARRTYKTSFSDDVEEDSAESRKEEDNCLPHSVKESASENCERKPLARRTYKTSFSEDLVEPVYENVSSPPLYETVCPSFSVNIPDEGEQPMMNGNVQPIRRSKSLRKLVRSYSLTTSGKMSEILKERGFHLSNFTLVIGNFFCLLFSLITVDVGIQNGLHMSQAVHLMTIYSAGQLFGRVGLGWITERKYVTKTAYFIVAHFIFSVVCLCFTFRIGFGVLVFLSAVSGVILGNLNPLSKVVYSDYLRKDQMVIAMYMSYFMVGVLAVIRSATVGYIRDYRGNYQWVYYFIAIVSCLTSLVWTFELFRQRRCKKYGF